MARIRTVKPEFFTSEDICALSPLARLLYIGTWLEADREGRLTWKPNTLKTRYLPNDAVDIQVLCTELIDHGLVVLYGYGFAYIPTFLEHQVINPRESKSKIPEPTAEDAARVLHASRRVLHAPSLPSLSVPFTSGGGAGGTNLILSPAQYAKRLEFCAFVGSRLEVPKALHRELVGLHGGLNPEGEIQQWYVDLNTEIEASGEPISPSIYKWLKARYQHWRPATSNVTDQIDGWAKS